MTPEELKELAEREREVQSAKPYSIRVCMAASCLSSGADRVYEALRRILEERGMSSAVELKGVGCLGPCSAGPLVTVAARDHEGESLYRQVKPADAGDVVASTQSGPVERLAMSTQTPFFKRQFKIVLENCGRIAPDRVEDYVAAQGYSALLRCLTELSPADTVAEMTQSGLRGRGGAGFPTGLKWGTVAKSSDAAKYVVCNGDEGDPGAFMDRSVLESDPHRVLEGMAIAGYAIGASKGFVYVRAEYPLAIKRLRNAIRQAERLNLLGSNICGTRFSFDVDIRLGAGAFVCGEETALLASIEGRRGQPRPRPPYPAEKGLFGHATLINNVETFANVPCILRRGGAWFASIGTEKSKGTKVFALAGQIVNTGIIEVPMGITLRDIVFEIGGGIPKGNRFKAVQTGGPSGGCIPEEHLDVAVDYDSLQRLGSIMGSGGMIVMDQSSSMVDVARYFMEFCMSESCGKCIPCRAGTYQMHGLLQKIATGHGTPKDLALLEELCQVVRETSLCGLGQTAPNPVISTLRYFRSEYEALLRSSESIPPRLEEVRT